MTQYTGTADVSMGRGAIVIGLAAIIIGEVLCDAIFRKGCNFAVRLGFVALGGVIYYAAMTVILWLKLDPNDLKLFTARDRGRLPERCPICRSRAKRCPYPTNMPQHTSYRRRRSQCLISRHVYKTFNPRHHQ